MKTPFTNQVILKFYNRFYETGLVNNNIYSALNLSYVHFGPKNTYLISFFDDSHIALNHVVSL